MVRFLLPRGHTSISGGNLYNAGLLAALEQRSAAERGSIDELPALLAAGTPGVFLLDTLDLERARSLGARSERQRFGLLVHHLPSLEPGTDPGEASADERATLAAFDFWVATSEFTRGLLIERGLAAERVVTLTPGLAPVARALRVLTGPLAAALIGNLIPRKGVLELLEALTSRLDARDRFELTIVGRDDLDPSYARACRGVVERATQLASVVRFAGALPPSAMPSFYRSASLLVSASFMETFGMALQEARAHGIPILALDRGNVRAHVAPGVNGWLADSIESLCDTLLVLSRAPEELHGVYARAQAMVLPAEDWDVVATRFLAWLARVDRGSASS